MPKIDGALEAHKLPTNSYGYSAVKMDQLQATEYTLVTIISDESGSVENFKPEMEKCLQEIIHACKSNPKSENLMVRHVAFKTGVREIHGFKLLSSCDPDSYLGSLRTTGATALFDAAEDGIMATVDYGRKLTSNDYGVNGIVFIITDGDDNSSRLCMADVKRAIDDSKRKESLESLMVILIGVNVQDAQISQKLNDFYKNAGLTQYVELKNANNATLAKLAAFIHQSVSSQSQMLGSGGPSQPLVF